MTNKKAVVAMSGGVDSSVAAALLVEQGYDVTGVMLKLWRGDDMNTSSGCCSLGASEDARRVADRIGIRFYCLNMADEFEATVIRDFQEEYARGRTPNPCVRCNQWIKFDALLDKARALGADFLATGHYVRLRERDGRIALLRGVDVAKDQSYVLWMLTQDQLRHCLFPIGEMEKSRTRALAEELGLRTARKPDSQEICFVRDGDTAGYVTRSVPAAARPGDIRDADGNVLGRHEGIGRFTVGQRKGLGISLGHPVFVTDIEPETASVVVGRREDLAVDHLVVEGAVFLGGAPRVGQRVLVQHRAHGEANPAQVAHLSDDALTLAYERPVLAVAPGQSAAFYADDAPEELLGGGIIAAATRARIPA